MTAARLWSTSLQCVSTTWPGGVGAVRNAIVRSTAQLTPNGHAHHSKVEDGRSVQAALARASSALASTEQLLLPLLRRSGKWTLPQPLKLSRPRGQAVMCLRLTE